MSTTAIPSPTCHCSISPAKPARPESGIHRWPPRFVFIEIVDMISYYITKDFLGCARFDIAWR